MRLIDWLVVAAYLIWVITDGLRKSRRTKEMEGYLLASRSLPWWAVGLSVMATQLSAITMTSTTGQGYADGLRFVQFYFGLPIAMIILSVTVVPFFWRARVYTAYEYLERRFDLKTRTLTAALFLISRGLSCSVIIAAPALILSIILGWNLTLTVLAIGVPTVVYTMIGGVQAVTWTDVKQMGIVVFGILAAVVVLILGLPKGMGLGSALHVAGAAGKMQALDFRFDLTQKYTFWSGMIGAVFLFLSYFGCDQSQVQRYLTAKSVQQGRQSLFVSAFVKIPLQALILLTGVLVFVFFLFNKGPMLFNSAPLEAIKSGPHAAEYAAIEHEYDAAFETRREAATALAGRDNDETRATFLAADQTVRDVRARASSLVRDETHAGYADVNYVFPSFVLHYMPVGLTGLLIAAIFLAAMSSSGGELNSLATTTVIDVYRRHIKPEAADSHYLLVSKLATVGWGVFVCTAAVYAGQLGSLIEVVNRYGSYFYGSILGVFILAIGVKRANGHGAFIGLIAGMVAVGLVATYTKVEFLWLNVVGAVAVTVVGMVVSEMTRSRPAAWNQLFMLRTLGLAIVISASIAIPLRQTAVYDLVITNARLVDGTGAPARTADVAILEGRIARIGRIPDFLGRQRLDATGLVLAPGFIDVHTHADDLADKPLAENFIHMGVTSVVAGNCGTSALRIGDELDRIESTTVAVNFATFIGHNTVRTAVMGTIARNPTIIEFRAMQVLVFKGMAEGAVGFSTGLQYVPGIYAKPNELIELARIAANEGGIYATHMRNEGTQIEESVAESIRLARRVEMPLEISHLKIDSPSRWGSSAGVLKLIDDARMLGTRVQADQYAYTAASSSLSIRFPAWVMEGGEAKMRARLTDLETWTKVKEEMRGLLAERGFSDLSWATVASYARDPSLNGKTMAQVATKMIGDDSADAQLEAARVLMINGGASMVYHSMDEQDVTRIMQHPMVSIAADASITDADSGVPHPRAAGNTARVLGEYVRERKVLSLEEAVRKMTSLPASFFGFTGRGVIREGAYADLVLFDAAKVKDEATYADPRAYPTGMPDVLVNGVFVVRDGKTTGARPGMVLPRMRRGGG